MKNQYLINPTKDQFLIQWHIKANHTPLIVNIHYFNIDNGFSQNEIKDIKNLVYGGSLIIGINDCKVTKIEPLK